MNSDTTGHDLSPEEIEVERILQEATKRLDEIDFWKRNSRDWPTPRLKPPGSYMSDLPGSKNECKKRLLDCRKDIVKAEAKEKAVQAIEKCSLPVQLRAYRKIDDWAEPKEDRKKDLEERTAKKKDMSDSQDVAMLKLEEKKEIVALPDQPAKAVEIAQLVEPQTPSLETPSFWDRFDASMGFNGLSGKEEYMPDKTDKEIEIELEPD